MSISFYSDKNYVYLFYRKQIKGKNISLKYFPGIKLPDGVKIVNNRTRVSSINQQLIKIELAVSQIEDSFDLSQIDSKAFLALIDEKLTGNTSATPFFHFCRVYYDDNVNMVGSRRAKSILTAINKIKKFKPNLLFSEIDKKFYRDLIKWLEEKNYHANYIGSILSFLFWLFLLIV